MAAADADYIKIADVEAVRDKLGSRIVAATGVMNSFDRMRIEGAKKTSPSSAPTSIIRLVRNLRSARRPVFRRGRRARSGNTWPC